MLQNLRTDYFNINPESVFHKTSDPFFAYVCEKMKFALTFACSRSRICSSESGHAQMKFFQYYNYNLGLSLLFHNTSKKYYLPDISSALAQCDTVSHTVT